MDTSDSENYESADEDFQSDEEILSDVDSSSDEQDIKKEQDCLSSSLQNMELCKSSEKSQNNAVSDSQAKDDSQSCKIVDNKDTDDQENVQKLEEENLWDDDELDWGAEAIQDSKSVAPTNQENPTMGKTNNPEQKVENEGWSSWGNWGALAQSVSSITSQITNVIETGIGAVDPEELARIEQEERKLKSEPVSNSEQSENNDPTENSYRGFGLGNLVKFVEDTGTKVISGGLDTLENIGKKTMEVLQEGDPGLKNKRALLKIDQDKPVLSQILREAKEKAENESRTSESASNKRFKCLKTLFDDYHGFVHLEALELLSKQCEIKTKSMYTSLTVQEYTECSKTMDQIRELSELPNTDDEEQLTFDANDPRLTMGMSPENLDITAKKFESHWEDMNTWLGNLDAEGCEVNDVHQKAIETLAKLTAGAMEIFHKKGETLVLKDCENFIEEGEKLVEIAVSLNKAIKKVGNQFCNILNVKAEHNKEVGDLITNVYFEAANCGSYIEHALELIMPVFNLVVVQQIKTAKHLTES